MDLGLNKNLAISFATASCHATSALCPLTHDPIIKVLQIKPDRKRVPHDATECHVFQINVINHQKGTPTLSVNGGKHHSSA